MESHVVARLAELGHAIDLSSSFLAAGASDEAVLELSSQADAILVPSDKDFGELVFRRQKGSSGVLLMRLPGLSPAEKANLVAALLNTHHQDLPGSFTVLSRGAVRIRRRN